MKRSNEVIRDILLMVEEEAHSIVNGKQQYLTFESTDSETKWLTLPGTDRDSAIYHWKLLLDESLVNGEIHPAFYGNMKFVFMDLTWAGHDFLDAIRQQPIWEEMNQLAVKNRIDIKSATSDLLLKLAAKAAERVLSGDMP